MGSLLSLKSAKDEFETLRKILSEKYGVGINKVSLNKIRYLEFTHTTGSIRLIRDRLHLRVSYIEFPTMISANSEYQIHREEAEIKKRAEIEKESFRDPSAL